jgi:hypothetical protein
MRRKGHYALVYALRAPARWEAGLPGVAGVSRPAMPPPRRRDRGPRRAARRSGPGSPGGAGPALNATGPPGAKTSADDPGHVHVLGGGVDDDAKDHLLDSVGALETRALDGHARRWPRARWGGRHAGCVRKRQWRSGPPKRSRRRSQHASFRDARPARRAWRDCAIRTLPTLCRSGAQRIPACAGSGLDAGGAVDGRAGNVFDESRSGA